MATPGELVRTIADALGIPEPTVTQHDRNLAMAGLRAMGGRGRSAAKVTSLDAARILVAILGSNQVRDSAETVRRFSDTRRSVVRYADDIEWRATTSHSLFSLPENHSFIDAVAALIDIASDHSQFSSLVFLNDATSDSFRAQRCIEIIIEIPSCNSDIFVRGDRPYRAEYSLHPEVSKFNLSSSRKKYLDDNYQYSGSGDLKQIKKISGWSLLKIGCALTGKPIDEAENL